MKLKNLLNKTWFRKRIAWKTMDVGDVQIEWGIDKPFDLTEEEIKLVNTTLTPAGTFPNWSQARESYSLTDLDFSGKTITELHEEHIQKEKK